MACLRRRVSWLVSGWLVCQLVTMTTSSAALCLGMSQASGTETCTCSHGDGHACPLHHSKDVRPTSPSDCACRSTTDPAAMVLGSLIGPSAVMPDVQPYAVTLAASAFGLDSAVEPPSLTIVPDGPPPRS